MDLDPSIMLLGKNGVIRKEPDILVQADWLLSADLVATILR
jgi:hypothetical protein